MQIGVAVLLVAGVLIFLRRHSPTARTRRVLEITGLSRIVGTFDSEAAALASCDNVEDKHVVPSAPQR